jgi:hypothetical protein
VLEDLFGEKPEIGVGREKLLICVVSPNEGFAENHDIIASSEGVWEVENRLHDDLRVLSACLVSAGAIEIPFWELID